MKHVIKKVLNETYEYQQLNNICQKLSTGSNKNSPEFMKSIIDFVNSSDVLPDNIKEKCNNVYKQWKSDMWNGVYKERTPYSGTGDSESDESDTYFTEIQSAICSDFMQELD